MPDEPQPSDPFGPNAWLVDEMFERYRQDPEAVSDEWREFFDGYRPGGANLARPLAPVRGDVTTAPSSPTNGAGPPTARPLVATPPAADVLGAASSGQASLRKEAGSAKKAPGSAVKDAGSASKEAGAAQSGRAGERPGGSSGARGGGTGS